jgi:hypothetical protein
MNVLKEVPLSKYSALVGVSEHECEDTYIKQALLQLDVFERTCLLLHTDGEFTIQDIAEIVEKSQEMVELALKDAHEHLRHFYHLAIERNAHEHLRHFYHLVIEQDDRQPVGNQICWLSALVVVLCALSWVVLAFMVPPLDGLLTAAHPMWQTVDWVMAVGPVVIMSLFSCILFVMVLMLYRSWMSELYEQSIKMAKTLPASPTPKPRTRRKRYQSLNPRPALEDVDE